MQVGDNIKAVATMMTTCASFHFSTMEEYYTGGLYLGYFNGITDGSAIYYFGMFLMAIAGNGFWRWPVANSGTPSEILLIDLIVFLNVIVQTVTVIMCLKTMFDHQRKESLAGQELKGQLLNSKDLVVQVLGYFIP